MKFWESALRHLYDSTSHADHNILTSTNALIAQKPNFSIQASCNSEAENRYRRLYIVVLLLRDFQNVRRQRERINHCQSLE